MLKRKKKKRGSRRIQLDDASAESYVAGLVEAAAGIRLPELFAKPHPRSIFSVPNRHGVAVTALRTTDLSGATLVDLLRFRLAQYLEVNFVEPKIVYDLRLEHESLDNVYPNDIHVLAGSVSDGEILCYATLKAAPDAPPGTTLRTRERPLLPVEQIHGWGIFNRLPILPDLPINQIRELGRFVKNQRYHGVEDKSIRGPVEVGVAIFRMIAETLSFELSGVVGDLEEAVAKQNLDFFNVPLVVVHGTMPVEQIHGWGIFNRLPILPDLPINQIRELGRFVKNQRYHGVEDKSIRGPVEVGVAIFRMIAETLSFELSGVVGDLEEAVAKQNLDFFNVPLVVVHGTMPVESEDSWLLPRYLKSTVFPFACLASDAATALPRLAEIEHALGRPGKLGLLSLMRLRSSAADTTPPRSSLEPQGGMAPLSEAQLPQQGVAMSDRRDVREAGDRLRETELFSGLSDAEASVLGTFVEQVAVEPGTVVVRQGDVADSLYVIHSGEVEVRSRGGDGESTVIATLGPGDYFGEIGVLTASERIADVVAMQPTELLRVTKDDYERYLAHVVEIDHELESTAAGRAAELMRHMLSKGRS